MGGMYLFFDKKITTEFDCNFLFYIVILITKSKNSKCYMNCMDHTYCKCYYRQEREVVITKSLCWC